MSAKLTVRQAGDVCIVDAAGRITLGEGAITIRDGMLKLVNEGHRKILLNLAEISYIDSSGIGEMVAAFSAVARQGGTLKLVNATRRIKDLLVITKVDSIFEVKEDEAAAIQSFEAN